MKRRIRLLINVIEHLPRTSHFVSAMAQDDELVDMHGEQPQSEYRPSITEFGATQEILASIRDELAHMNRNFIIANSDPKKPKPRPPTPWPRPETARDRAKLRWAKSTADEIVSAMAPKAAT